MASTKPSKDRRFLLLACAIELVGATYIALSALVATEMSGWLSIALAGVGLLTAITAVQLYRAARWAFISSLALATLVVAYGALLVTLVPSVPTVGLTHTAIGIIVMAALLAGKSAIEWESKG